MKKLIIYFSFLCLSLTSRGATSGLLEEVINLPAYGSMPIVPLNISFAYTGAEQSWTVPANVYEIYFDLVGASGGTASGGGWLTYGGTGAKITGILSVIPGQVLNINVGGYGLNCLGNSLFLGGLNGGGGGELNSGSGGGGASDIRIGGTELEHRIAVAAGGGGANTVGGYGGNGGGNGNFSSTLGTGENGRGGGGGGGYYGGDGGPYGYSAANASGGSNHIDQTKVFQFVITNGNDRATTAKEHGSVSITYTATPTPEPTPTPTPTNYAEMVIVQGGTLPVGSTFSGQKAAPLHIGRFETTWGEWKTVRTWAAANGYDIGTVGEGSADNHPVRNVNWYDVVKWCNAKSEKEGLSPVYFIPLQYPYDLEANTDTSGFYKKQNGELLYGPNFVVSKNFELRKETHEQHTYPVYGWYWFDSLNEAKDFFGLEVFRTGEFGWDGSGVVVTVNSSANGYRLPSEKEWEWAARGGVSSQGYTYSGSNTSSSVAWDNTNSSGGTNAVGTKAANELGIYDMSGNVHEWNWDTWG